MEFAGHTILSPLTKGGNLPFRRLCVEFGAKITVSEMAYARQVNRGSRSELALLRSHPSETGFGVQIAASKAEEAVKAGERAVAAGARFVDLNCGCPIHDVVRRGMGATLLKRPSALARVVQALADGLSVPVTVKIRAGWNEEKTNAPEVARLCEEAGAQAITLHARSREQRYSKAADWSLVRQLVEERSIPIVGNGDILTHFEARRRQEQSGCASVMVARGALIKPWIFREIAEGRPFEPTAEERVGIYRRLADFMKEHFRDDEKGRDRAMRFLPFHMGFFWRYRPLPEAEFGGMAEDHPLLQTRHPVRTEGAPLERLLQDPREATHGRIAGVLWDAPDAAAALAGCQELAEELPPLEAEDAGRAISTSHG